MSTAVKSTQLFNDSTINGRAAMNHVYPIIYRELHSLARKQLRHIRSVDTICTTVLVNETYLKLIRANEIRASNKAHFFAMAATAMRQILINYAEQKHAQKRGGGWHRVTYEESLIAGAHDAKALLDVNHALDEIRIIDKELAHLVELRFFVGLTEIEIAHLFGITERTIRRNWKKAKALLAQALNSGE